MRHRDAPCRIREHVSIQQIGTETLVYDERRHLAFCLNESSSVIWSLANGERTIAQISGAASLQLKTPVSEDLVLFAFNELRRDGLMEPTPNAEVGEDDLPPRHAAEAGSRWRHAASDRICYRRSHGCASIWGLRRLFVEPGGKGGEGEKAARSRSVAITKQ